jgi:hypothetical protein
MKNYIKYGLFALIVLLFSSTGVNAYYQISGLDPILDAYEFPWFTNMGTRVEFGDEGFTVESPTYIGIYDAGTQTLLATLQADTSVSDLDWSSLTAQLSLDRGSVYVNGLSGLPGALTNGSIYINKTAGIGGQKLTTHDVNTSESLGGSGVQIDDNNNIALAVGTNTTIQLYLWNNTSSFSRDNNDYKIDVVPDLSTYAHNYQPSVIKLGNNQFMVTWNATTSDNATNFILTKIIDSSGNVVGDTNVITSSIAGQSKVKGSKINNNQIMLTWGQSGGIIMAALVSNTGTIIGSPFQVSDGIGYFEAPDVDTLADGRYVFVYGDTDGEVIYYRIWDPGTSEFSTSQTLLNLGANQFGGYSQTVSADDQGGFAILAGGYASVGGNQRVYMQIFDNVGDPLYTDTADMLISNDTTTTWYSGSVDLKYDNGFYHLVWDTYYDAVTGIRYRKVAPSGTKSTAITISEFLDSNGNIEITAPSIDMDRNGVPVIVWNTAFGFYDYGVGYGYMNVGLTDVVGVWNVIPADDAIRIGICPNATNISEVDPSCDSLVYKLIGDPDVVNSSPVPNEFSFKLDNFNSGGAYIDGAPAIAFKDFNITSPVSTTMSVDWYDTGALGGGIIDIYYDNNNSGNDGTLLAGGISASEGTNTYDVDVSTIPDGTYWLYAVIDDEFYSPFYAYSLHSFTKTTDATPTPTATVAPTPTGTTNIAPVASAYTCTANSSSCAAVADGASLLCNAGEWFTAEPLPIYVQMNWDTPRTINRIRLYDRMCGEYSESGTIDFGDLANSVENWTITTNDGYTDITFEPKEVSWVKVNIAVGSGGGNIGFNEVEVHEINVATPTPTDTPIETPTETPTPTPTDTPIVTPTDTPIVTPTDTPVQTPTPTNTSVPTNTPTPVASVLPTNTSLPGDTTPPDKVVITSISAISNVQVADYVTYYFTAQNPVIRGTAEPLSTVHFTYNSEDYFAQANNLGNYTVYVTNPLLPRTTVELHYYAIDSATNRSAERILKLIIGEENFPAWLITKLHGGTVVPTPTTRATITVTVTPTPTIIRSITPTVSPTVKITALPQTGNETIPSMDIVIKDQNGNPVANKDIKIDNKAYKTDGSGKVTLTNVSAGNHNVEVDGKIQGIQINAEQQEIPVYFDIANATTTTNSLPANAFIFPIIALAVVSGLFIVFSKKRIF